MAEFRPFRKDGHGDERAFAATEPPVTLVSDDDLHAYVDGALEEERRLDIEAYLRANPVAAQKVKMYREQVEALRRRFDPILDEPIPERLLELLQQKERRK